MEISPNGVELIKHFEGLVLHAYKDPGSKNGLPITIGYGNTAYRNGAPIKLGDVITTEKANEMLYDGIAWRARAINKLGLPFNQNQFDAVCSFVYNIGLARFMDSTWLRKARRNVNNPTLRAQFMRWVRNDGRILSNLVVRRKQEADLYFK